jgi:hypothetical protein
MPTWGEPIVGCVIDFSGRVTQLKNVTRSQATVTVSAWTVLLNVNMGPDVFQAGCLNTHYDPDCGLDPTAFTFAGAAAASPPPTATSFATTSSAVTANGDHYYDKGTVTFTSGANAGLSRTVQTYAGGAFSFAFGFPFAPLAGDTFTALRGCLLTLADCEAQRTVLDAEQHFRGQPFTPPAVTPIGG